VTAHSAAVGLQQMAALLAEAQRVAKLGSWEWLPQTGEMLWSDQLFAIFGLPPSRGASLEAYRERIHPEDVARIEEKLREDLDGERTETRDDFRVVLPDDSIRMIEGRGRITRDADGRVTRLFGTCLDVTEAWTAHEALRVSEERFRSLIAATVSSS